MVYKNICTEIHVQLKCENINDDDLHYPVTFIKYDILSLTKFGENAGYQNKPPPYIEVSLHKMGDITHFLDDVTHFSPTLKMGWDRYMELGPKYPFLHVSSYVV